jgi:hypothetical protein
MSNQQSPPPAPEPNPIDNGKRRDQARQLLLNRRADSVAHLNGYLLDHLERTEGLLLSWGCSRDVSTAGLCHAVYGTDGFPTALLGLNERDVLAAVVGSEVEALVYLYASCDREFVYPRLSEGGPASFKDRFTGLVFAPTPRQLQNFVAITLANESDVGVIGSGSLKIPEWLLSLHSNIQHLATESVREGFQDLISRADV